MEPRRDSFLSQRGVTLQAITHLKRPVGTSPAFFLFLALLSIAGCSDSPGLTESVRIVRPAAIPLLISGEMTPQYQSVRVSRGDEEVADAIVTVNGFRIRYSGRGLYSGNLPAAVPAGEILNVKVIAGGVTFDGSGEVLATPVITTPAAGSTFARTDTISLAWNIMYDPEKFGVCLNCADDFGGTMYPADGGAREFKIAPDALVDHGGGAVVAVYAYNSSFLRSTNSPQATSKVLFLTRSSDALIAIKR
jgi:hypothetical protein